MKTTILFASLLALSTTAFASDLGVSINIGEPGFYGRIDIGNAPRPPVMYAQPVIIERPAHYVAAEPLYLRVPPGHAKNWAKHCREYNACGRQVYFVRDEWYTNEYAPRYRDQHRPEHGHENEHGRDHDDHGHDHDDRGHDEGHGKGHDRDHDHDRHDN